MTTSSKTGSNEEAKIKGDDDEDLEEFESIFYDKETYRPGDCVYILPTVYDYVIPSKNKPEMTKKAKHGSAIAAAKDPVKYPEYYRKIEFSSDYIKGSNEQCPPPYRVARILKIYRRYEGGSDVDSDSDGGSAGKRRNGGGGGNCFLTKPSYKILVRKFYRPEDTHLEETETREFDLNCLFWTDEETTVRIEDVRGKCFVRYFDPWTSKAVRDEYFLSAPDRFYFQKSYNSLARRFCGAPMEFLAPKSAIPKCEVVVDGGDDGGGGGGEGGGGGDGGSGGGVSDGNSQRNIKRELMVVVEKLNRGEMEDVRLTPVPDVPKMDKPLRFGDKLRCVAEYMANK